MFFLCPTVYGGGEDDCNMSLDDEDARSDFLGAINMEKGIYDAGLPGFLPPTTARSGLNVYETARGGTGTLSGHRL